MPSENTQPQSSQARPGAHRSTSSSSQPTSPAVSPPHGKSKAQKHVVHGAGRIHSRVPSSKGLHKLTKVHGTDGSHAELKKLGKNSSATNLKKNSSHVSLKRNRSSADVHKRPKSPGEQAKRPTSVHFEIGDQEDAWEEASSSASPALSRSGHASFKSSANNSQPHSPLSRSQTQSTNGSSKNPADAKIITERLLNRTPSLSTTTTKMSLTTATPAGHSPGSLDKTSTLTDTPKVGSKEEMVSRFVGSSGTPSENSPFLQSHHRKADLSRPKHGADEVKRAQSMGNLTRHDSSSREDDDESALAPRSRKSSTHAYNPPQQSRTQQKLWLQRASSNIEPAQLTPGAAINGMNNLHGLGGTPLVGAGYDGRDPRIKLQLERTGLEYLVVRRHQDPIGLALKRLGQLPGAEKYKRIPQQNARRSMESGNGGHGLSQSLKESRSRTKADKSAPNGARSSYEGQSAGSHDSDVRERGDQDDGVGAILRSMWEKNFDLSASTD